MKRKVFIKWSLILFLTILLTGSAVFLYLFYLPHRDVVSLNADFNLRSEELVEEYLRNAENANQRYLDDEGQSKIISVTGTVFEIEEDFSGNKVVLLMSKGQKAGVSCTFTKETSSQTDKINSGQEVTIKGVIRSGASFDEDMEIYENVILEKCTLINY